MAIFDDIVSQVDHRFGLHGKARSLISLLLSPIVDPTTGGLGGFLDRLRKRGLDTVADRMLGGSDTTPLTKEQLEQALGGDHALHHLASEVGLSESTIANAAGFLLPRIIGILTPEGSVPAHLSGEVQEFIRLQEVGRVETERKHEPVVATATARPNYEAPHRETHETRIPRDVVVEPQRRETYEAPRRETYEAPRREFVREAPRRPLETTHERDDSSWFWWALPLVGLALLGAYATKACTPVKEPGVYPPTIARREARPPRTTESTPQPGPAPLERREPVTEPKAVEPRETVRTPVTIPPAVASRLAIERLDDGRVRVSGVVVDDSTRRAVLTALETAFGSGKVVADIAVNPRAEPANWLARLPDIAKLVAANLKAAITLEGNKVALGGSITDADRRTLVDTIKTYLGTNFTVE